MDFLYIQHHEIRKDVVEFEPDFLTYTGTGEITDLMTRGGDFYAAWIDERKMWSTKESDIAKLIDEETYRQANEFKANNPDKIVKVKAMKRSSSGVMEKWHKYVKRHLRDNFVPLDEKLTFANTETVKEDYASKRLSYPLVKGDCPAWDKLIGTLYSAEERQKIEWAIGSIVSGASKTLQKFMVIYGAAGTGKSTILNIISDLFEGYVAVFDAKALGSSNQSFALEAFHDNPLVAIQHDGDLSRIEDNTRINSVVSHEVMTVNEKYKSAYPNRFKCFLFMGTNKPVKITDAKSGIIRRLIDVRPSGDKLSAKEYKDCLAAIEFEHGAIANHCLEVFNEKPDRYDNYTPLAMMEATNDFYNFVLDNYAIFKNDDETCAEDAWKLYQAYNAVANVAFPLPLRQFKAELANYFKEHKDRGVMKSGKRVRNYYSGFRTSKFEIDIFADQHPEESGIPKWLTMTEQHSILDDILADCPAQEAVMVGEKGDKPKTAWDLCKTTLRDICTTNLHYVLAPGDHIFIDFDLKDENGNKSFELNAKEAAKWPKTYAETSKSGEGIHLHYIYAGDPAELDPVFSPGIEVKVCYGKRPIRRKLTKCNNEQIATISSGLPTKGGTQKVIDQTAISDEQHLLNRIKKNLNKECVPSTRQSIDLIIKDLKQAYESGMKYDVTSCYGAVFRFACLSTNQSSYCMEAVERNKQYFKSEEAAAVVEVDDISEEDREKNLTFLDVEITRPDPENGNEGLFFIGFKTRGDHPVIRLFNPTPREVQKVMSYDFGAFNGRKYDNHMLYARAYRGYSNEALYDLSTRLTSNDKDISKKARFGNAYNASYIDVYDYPATKMGLKKWEIALKIPHKEFGHKWDEPVPKELWNELADYCCNDVLACEAVFEATQPDFTARKILAHVSGKTVNDTTNTHTTTIIFGNDKEAWKQFNYRDLGKCSDDDTFVDGYDEYTRFNKGGKPVFPGYTFEEYQVTDEKTGKTKTVYKSMYRGEEVGEGGYVYAEPGMYGDVSTSDSASHHPSTIVAEEFFGPVYTKRFKELLDARIAIKHGDIEKAKTCLDGRLAKFIDSGVSLKDLAYALKIAINSVYGLTSAKFPNPFKHPDNHDNFVAKRGALFMVNLKHEVQKRGFKVIHIKTDSIKIPDATPEIMEFVAEYGRLYGYNFEHESMYDRICLVNDACFVAKHASEEKCKEVFGYIPEKNNDHAGEWTAVAEQFKVPYVFKTLFSKEPVIFDDLCETRSVSTALYLTSPTVEGEKRFVGRVGQFTPMLPGYGGELLREGVDANGNQTFGYADDSKGYFWMESEDVKTLGLEDKVNMDFYEKQVQKAVETIAAYGNFEWFVSDEPYVKQEDEVELPFN